MKTYYFYLPVGYPRPHGDLVCIGQMHTERLALDEVKYQARRYGIPMELVTVQADVFDEAVMRFNHGEGVKVCRVTAETTYKIEKQ